ncbi:MAG: beta-ketoacyl-ACP synthase II, partial [Chloroflexi bacterium]
MAPRSSGRGHRVSARRAVVTGLGVVSPVGIGADVAWEALVAGRSGIADITLFDTTDYDIHVAGEVKGFDVAQYMDAKDARRHDRNTHFAVAASGEALRDAGLLNGDGLDAAQADRDRFGMVIGTGIGGIGLISDGIKTLMERGVDRVSPFLLPNMIPDAASGMVAIRYGLRGPNMAVVSACATGGHAIGEAMEAIVRGQADLMLGAGTEAVVVPIALAGFSQMKALGSPIDPDTGAYDPAVASRPFDATRNGFVVSEGCAVMVLEEAEHAKARGAKPIAEVIGYGSSSDAFHMAAPAERGEGNQRAMRAALERADIGPEEVGYINAHGTST